MRLRCNVYYLFSCRSFSQTVAVWAKTGTWATLQVVSGLTQFAETHQRILWNATQQAIQSRLGGLWSALPAASGTALTASSISGSASSLAPWTIYGLAAVAAPRLLLWHTQRKWQALTEELNAAFFELTVQEPPSETATEDSVEDLVDAIRVSINVLRVQQAC